VLDLSAETPLPLTAAAKMVPPARSGKRTHLSTLLRWIIRGVKNPNGEIVRLEAVRLGGRWVTSQDALQRFAERLTPRIEGAPAAVPRTPERRRRASERAAAELERQGI
jgi:hypothetical protein